MGRKSLTSFRTSKARPRPKWASIGRALDVYVPTGTKLSNIEPVFYNIYQLSYPYQTEMDALKKYTDDLEISALPAEFQVLGSVFKNVKAYPEEIRKIIAIQSWCGWCEHWFKSTGFVGLHYERVWERKS